MTPAIGRIVHYRSKHGNYTLPAIITATAATIWPPGVETEPDPDALPRVGAPGNVPEITGPERVHLWVFTPARRPEGGWQEFDIPPASEHGPDAGEQEPGTYRWPVAP